MNIQDIRYIASIAEAGSINKAAERLLITQPSLSRHIQKVEKECGITLFNRSRGNIPALTEEGKLFIQMAREVLNSYDHFTEQLQQRKQQGRNYILLGTTNRRAISIVDPLCKRLHEIAPGLFVVVQAEDGAKLIQRVQEGSLDMAIVSHGEGEKEIFDSLYCALLYTSRMGILLRTGSPVAEKARQVKGLPYPVLTLQDLQNETFGVNLSGSKSRKYVERLMEKTGIELSLIELPNRPNRLSMVKSGQASLFTMLDDYRSFTGEPYYSLPPEQSITERTYLICRKEQHKSVKFKAIYQCLRGIYS